MTRFCVATWYYGIAFFVIAPMIICPANVADYPKYIL